jgi:hypothetical protein
VIKTRNLPDRIFGIDSRMFLLWLEPVALIIVLFFSLVIVIIPKFQESLNRITEIKALVNKIVEVNQKRNYLQSVDQEEIKNNVDKLSLGLLPEKNAYMLVRVVRNVAAEAGYSIDDFSVNMGNIKGEETGKRDNMSYDKIPVAVTLAGPTENYLTLVKSIERSLPIMSIDKLEMNSVRDQVSTVELEVSAYYLREITGLKMENLTLADLTPSQDEINLLTKISEYRTMVWEGDSQGTNFTKYERLDPFSTL